VPKIRLKTQVMVTVWILLFLALNLYCYYRLKNENDAILQEVIQRIVHQRNAIVMTITNQLKTQFNSAGILSHSLSLRRKIIKHNQVLMEKAFPDQTSMVESELAAITLKGKMSDTYLSISTSLEADFLRDIIEASGSCSDRIFVTDAFGFVRISSHSPEDIYYFQHEWWQRALMVEPGQFYRYFEPADDHTEFLYIAYPLYNDEGLDPVGVVNQRINLEKLFSHLEDFREYLQVYIYIFTDQNYNWEPDQPELPVSLTELKAFSNASSDTVYRRKQNFLTSSSVLPAYNLPVLPSLKWSIMTIEILPVFYTLANPAIRSVLITWILAVIVISSLSVRIASWISKPIISFMSATRAIASKGNGPASSADSSWLNPSEILDQLNRAFEQTTIHKTKLLRESMASIKAFSEYTKAAALEYDRKVIAESLLSISVRNLCADAGVLFIQNPDYISPMVLHYNLTAEQVAGYTSLRVHDYDTKRLYFSWDHQQHKAIWNDDFQVLISVPIQTRQTRFGTLYLLFKQAVELDIENDQTLDLLAQQCAVYSSRSGLFHQLERQVSFTEGILSGIPWFICIVDSQMRITWHNNHKGIPFHESVDRLIGTLCHTSFMNRESVCPDCPVKKTLLDSRPHEITQCWDLASNEIRWIKLNTYPYKDETTQSRSAILFIRDITTDVRAQSEIRRFSMAIDNIGEAVIITDMEGRIVFTNKAFTRIFDYSEKNVVGHHLEFLFSGEESGIFKKIVTIINRDKIWMREMDLLHRSEKRIATSLTATQVLDESGNPIGLVITCFDLSARLQREKQIIKSFKELEILHKINKTLSRTADLDEILHTVLVHIATFTGCKSGAVILYDKFESDERYPGTIRVDAEKPSLFSELELPGYFSNFIDEYRRGRTSVFFDAFRLSDTPVILDNLPSQSSIESKLITRMGFKAMLAIPIYIHSQPLGLFLIFSKNSYHFPRDDIQIYQSIAAQTGISIYGRYLQEKLLSETKHTVAGEIVSRIGTDIKQVLQGLDASRHRVENAFQSKSWPAVRSGWNTMNWQIWQLDQIMLNFLLHKTEDLNLFFPEDINNLITLWLRQIKEHSYAENITITFNACKDIGDVYVNKVAIHRAFINILTLTIDACWFKPDAAVTIHVQNSYGKHDFYAIEINHNGSDNKSVEHFIQNHTRELPTADMPVLLSIAIRWIENHKGSLIAHSNDGRTTFRIVLPRYPIKI
jgi:PAS domain S-box-containing protein